MLDGIINILVTDNTVRSLVGQNKALNTYKVFPVVATQGENIPYITTLITGRDVMDCKGGVITTSRYTFATRCFSYSYDNLEAMNDAVVEALHNETGTYSGINFQEIRYQTERDDFQNHADRLVYIRESTFTATVNG